MSGYLHNFLIEKYVKQALEEDVVYGDITTDCFYGTNDTLKAVMNFRSDGIVCGVDVVKCVFKVLDPEVEVSLLKQDGDTISAGENVAIIEGNARAILTGERTALNFMQRMSAIATETNKYQQAISPYNAKITDTRKTTPNFRLFEKYAVQIGGGSPHRFCLSDCVMLKDNHIELAGSIKKAVELVRANISHTHKIEVETENMQMVKEAVEAGADIIMLDNMSVEDMKQAVDFIGNKAITEASGNVNLKTVNNVASSGVDYISTSAIVAKAGTIDIGLDI